MEESNVVTSQDAGEAHAFIDIEEGNQSILWADSIEQKLSQRSNPSFRPTSCIYRVHKRIRKLNEEAYTPDVVSIGPYHRGKPNLQAMEDHKLQYVKALLDRTKKRTSLEKYVEALRKLEAEARECYSEPINLSSKDFVEMMLFDGLFIIELFRKDSNVVPKDDNDPIFNSSSKGGRIIHDLILLENQIPMSVLQCLFDLSKDPNHDSDQQLIKIALSSFRMLIPEAMDKYPHNNNTITHKHLLDLLSYTLDGSLRTADEMPKFTSTQESMPCVMELRRSGVKFKKNPRYDSLIHIKFINGVFEIPPLCVDDYKDSFFRNLIAYEQYRIRGTSYITSYVMLMDYLINSAEDVAYLRDHGIIINQLGDDNKVLTLFSNVCSEIFVNRFYYSKLCDEVNEYYRRPRHKLTTILKHDYCNNPWMIISVIAGFLLLFFTAWGALFTTLPFFNLHA